MKRILRAITLLIVLTIPSITGCEQPLLSQITPTPEGTVITIGFTTSLSGPNLEPSTEQTNGILLWIKNVNQSGGLRLATGEVITLAYKTYDDRSDATTAAEMYEKLITTDNVDLLIGPYSNELTAVTAPIANDNGKIFVSAGADADAIFQNNFTSVYQIYSPSSGYFKPTLEILDAIDPGARRVAILIEDEAYSKATITAITPSLQILGYQIVFQETYPSGTIDFSPWVNNMKASIPNVILAGGNKSDGMMIAIEMKEQGVDTRMISLLRSPAASDFNQIGEAAFGIMGPSQWEASVYLDDATSTYDQFTWIGPSSGEFVIDYRDEYGSEPTYIAAGGYTAGLVLQYAIDYSGSIRTSYMIPIIDHANLSTFFGRLKFDNQGRNYGTQIEHELLYIQWQYDTDGTLIKRPIWPIELASSPLVYPLP